MAAVSRQRTSGLEKRRSAAGYRPRFFSWFYTYRPMGHSFSSVMPIYLFSLFPAVMPWRMSMSFLIMCFLLCLAASQLLPNPSQIALRDGILALLNHFHTVSPANARAAETLQLYFRRCGMPQIRRSTCSARSTTLHMIRPTFSL